ncbi:hypothetical protein FALBO_851 [Fusarium albosuccineum]|uniref:Uncharacterized protein n=1 Tax=Fusarium albosuccineum TaxID=1237068 RepID=A0A8H4PE48_9HYPO|nr:hypothetical protein FALBO_851 [Fusarium albosuccineum]
MPSISSTPTLEASESPSMIDVCETPRVRASESAASCYEEDAHDKPNFDTIAAALIKVTTEIGKLNNLSDIRILSTTMLPMIQCLLRKIDDIKASTKAELDQIKDQIKAQMDAWCRQVLGLAPVEEHETKTETEVCDIAVAQQAKTSTPYFVENENVTFPRFEATSEITDPLAEQEACECHQRLDNARSGVV